MQNQIAEIFQAESGRVVALLYAHIRDFELVEDAVQDTFVQALENWPEHGLPDNPAAWLHTVARRKAIDRLRRDQNLERKKAILKTLIDIEQQEPTVTFDSIPDERLKLIFTCCHPALKKEAQVALTLRTLGGLTTEDIARAFLVPVPTMAQRLVRAKRKIRDAGIPFQIPPRNRLAERLDVVLSVLYLIFNAGYVSPSGAHLMRQDLSVEAVRLTRILLHLLEADSDLTAEPEVMGLLALMLLHDSRAAARIDAEGQLIPLEDQDRTQWNQAKIEEGKRLLQDALALRRAGPYQIQAAISAVHADAPSAADTDWAQIVVLYDLLNQMMPSPIIALNQTVAIAMAQGFEVGLRRIDTLRLQHDLENYYLLHAARADLLRRLERWHEAASAYTAALDLCQNEAEQRFLAYRLQTVRTQLSSN